MATFDYVDCSIIDNELYAPIFSETKARKAKFGFTSGSLNFRYLQEFARCQRAVDPYVIAGKAYVDIRQGNNVLSMAVFTDDQDTRDALYRELIELAPVPERKLP